MQPFPSQQTLLVILDGFGINPESTKNAITSAQKPNLDNLFENYPFTTIEAGGEKVGLPKGVIGNSEVGHMNLGAGRPVRQDLVRINESIREQKLGQLERFVELIKTAQANSKRIHLMGLLSDGGVHSHISHIEEIIAQIHKADPELKTFFHAFMDGRDTAQDVGEKYIQQLSKISAPFEFASMQGRSIGMDRDRRWEKIQNAYETLTGKRETSALSPSEYLKSEYEQGRFDEFINPVLFDVDGTKNNAIQAGDCVFFVNFRPDRAIQITLAFTWPEFKEFPRDFIPPYYLCMTPYVPEEVELPILFDKERIKGGLCEHLSGLGKKVFKIAETEKYAHVTYFFNGGTKTPYPGEDQVLIPSPREVKTYDEKPQMSAYEVTDKLLEALDSDYDLMVVNYANCDMVGHTGNYEAAIKAVEAVDECVGKLIKKCEEKNKKGESITLVLTADHGNSDEMTYSDGSPHTSHSAAPVPFALYHPALKGSSIELNIKDGALMDVGPSILSILGYDYPPSFQGKSIFKI